ncbi:hypothetical protein CDD82_7032 [Ophiocordyceps australis]|uniref:Heterokaryon incompatibility domain-containing protein n=1 Tax=Ophiocordyceps australis TaxID=1399860 RepID=A0A2C5XFI9_9HYPO|nr:hypothetical protein CDD82_7032 [Ophiocordyceps australis]
MMKRLILASLASSLAGAFPSVFECARNPCYDDILHMTGNIENLVAQCSGPDGSMRPGVTTKLVADKFVRANPSCGISVNHVRYYREEDFRPICNCLLQASIPRHCDSNRCWRDLYQGANESVLTLRNECATYDYGDISFQWTSFLRPPQCGTKLHNMLVLHEHEWRPVCSCITSDYDAVYPATQKVMRQDSFGQHIIDVFLHVVYYDKGEIEGEFRHIISDVTAEGIIFIIKSIDLTIDGTWAVGRENEAMRKALHKGDNRDLNFYMIDDVPYDNTDRIAPLTGLNSMYCTPPPFSTAWGSERLGDPIIDGCIIGTGVYKADMADVFQRWLGTCDFKLGQCPRIGVWETVRRIHQRLAEHRYVPFPRGAVSPYSYIQGEVSRKRHCEHIDCFDDIRAAIHLKGGNVTEHCYSGLFNSSNNLRIPRTEFPPYYMNSCGQWTYQKYYLEAFRYHRVCQCLLQKRRARWDFTQDVLLGHDAPIVVDIFAHYIASNSRSSMALKYMDFPSIEYDMEILSHFFSATKLLFRLKTVDLTINAAWAEGNQSARMRQALYTGGQRDLNLYFIERPNLQDFEVKNKTISVFCSFPFSAWWALLSGADPEHDGCLIANGASIGTLAASIQHWLGVQIAVPKSCSDKRCGPRFEADDINMINTAAALNRVVPHESPQSRLRLYQALDV